MICRNNPHTNGTSYKGLEDIKCSRVLLILNIKNESEILLIKSIKIDKI